MADKPLWNEGDDDGLVTSPPDYYYPGSVIEYAPGYRILAGDEFRLRPKYDDANVEFARRMTLTNPEAAFAQQSLLASAGYLNKNDVGALWSKDVADAYAKAMTDANSQYMSLDDYLKLKSGQRKASGGGGGGGPTSYRNVSKSVSITSRPTAQALLKQTLAAELGREPTNAEVDRFVKALNKRERANPSVTVTTGSSSGGNSTSNSTTTPSSVDPGAEAEEYAETVNPTEAHRFQTGELYDVISRMAGF
jgi:hypothetical protein